MSLLSRTSRPLRLARRLAATVIGGTVLVLGAAMLVLPGPGLVGIILGLSILATEFAWASRLLKRARDLATNGWNGRGAALSAGGAPKPESPREE